MDAKRLNRIIGFFVFVIALFTFFSTVQPSVSFWDCGEFIASSYGLQVPHPPGTPFFILVGRIFSMIPFVSNIGLRVNTISVLTSSFAILFLYLVAVKAIENWKGKNYKSLFDAILTYSAAAIGALSLAFSDTFWFNAAEAEVYASATFFIAIVTWLLMIWNEKADEPDSEKYLIMIAYLIGVSTGVHLMSLLALVSIVMVIYYKKYLTDEVTYIKTTYIFLGHIVVVLIIGAALWASTSNVAPSQDAIKAFDSRFLMIEVAASLIYMGIFYKKILQKNSIYIPLIVGGIVLAIVYPGILKYFPILIAAVSGSDFVMNIVVIAILFGVVGYIIHWAGKNQKETINLAAKAFLFAVLGFTSYTMIIIKANENPPINLNNPDTVPRLVSYLSRAQYGIQPTFKRRFSQEKHQQGIYKNYSSDLDFLIRYQMGHMFHRYLLWNYVGRNSTVQDSGVNWSEFFAIPFLLGLFGLYYQFRRDWKLGSAFLMMFIFLGYLTAYYQNQQQPQPRERDYFYVGAFFVYSLWIAVGMRGIFDLIFEQFKDSNTAKILAIIAIIIGFLLVPINMLKANYHTHDRSRNYLPWDYAYNILQSASQNAILFTNGDNDTFPVWYLQDVEGVRRDIRIVNLSLLNTPWYIKQLKNQTPYGAEKVPFSFSDKEIDRIGPSRWETRTMRIKVPEWVYKQYGLNDTLKIKGKKEIPDYKEIYKKYGLVDTSLINKKEIVWKMKNTVQYGKVKAIRVQDIMTLDIIKANKWKRPIYFAVTTGYNQINLNNYLVVEGMAYKLVPFKHSPNDEVINPKIMSEDLLDEPSGFSKTYKPGFKFRGLNDSTIFFDALHRGYTNNYRMAYFRLVNYYLIKEKNKQKALEVLNTMEQKIPREVIPVDYRLLNDIATLYLRAGDFEHYKSIAKDVEKTALKQIENNPTASLNSPYNPYQLLMEVYDNLKEYDKLVGILEKVQALVPNDPRINQLINRYKKMAIAQDTAQVK
ncbi:hypothetical protein BMS3Abin04_02362 [bacterium BMS3Abin04]|nr:hypothetical protein BMS3Abin04_02362 [bacterium BMS3Abin04]